MSFAGVISPRAVEPKSPRRTIPYRSQIERSLSSSTDTLGRTTDATVRPAVGTPKPLAFATVVPSACPKHLKTVGIRGH